jgi:hypothetical protein
MPNWCENNVYVTGDPEDVAAFRVFVETEESPFDFEKILPTPPEVANVAHMGDSTYVYERDAPGRPGGLPEVPAEEVQRLIQAHGYADGWHWRVANWGTKWDLDPEDVAMEETTSSLWYGFMTAWSPPAGIYAALRRRFPLLSISWRYDEPGLELHGYLADEVSLEPEEPRQPPTDESAAAANGQALLPRRGLASLVSYPSGTPVISADGALRGQLSGGHYACRLKDCRGRRLRVVWPDGKVTFPCSRGMTFQDGAWVLRPQGGGDGS